MNISIGQIVKVVYDPRPVFPRKEMEGIIAKITKTGFIKIKTENGIYDEALFYSPLTTSPGRRNAKGWNTLWWEELL